MTEAVAITEEWLKSVGFKWHQLDRQPNKHWLLWLGRALAGDETTFGSFDDIGIEVASMRYRNSYDELVGRDAWFVWFRGDSGGRYHRFIHVRHMRWQHELIKLIEAITGQDWNPENHFYGSVCTPAQAARNRQDDERLDRQLMREGYPWSEVEKDDSRGRALPEHLEAHAKMPARAND